MMTNFKTMLAATAATMALLLGGCTATTNETAPAMAQGPAAGAVGANGRINGDPALWVVKDADTTVYLFGTVHVLRPDVDWFDGAVKTAYDRSGDLVLEMVEPAVADAQKIVMSKALNPTGPSLTQKLGPDLAAKYRAAMAKAELPVPGFERFDPWFAATILGTVPLQKLGYSADSGVETVLTKAAKAAAKPVSGLETIEQQLSYFDTLPEALQIKFLASTIEDVDNVEKEFADLIGSWTRGDADRLAALMNEALTDSPEIAKVLLSDRNKRWAQTIDDRMDRPGVTFIAVGAGHLAGTDSVQRLLTQRGLKVTRVQ